MGVFRIGDLLRKVHRVVKQLRERVLPSCGQREKQKEKRCSKSGETVVLSHIGDLVRGESPQNPGWGTGYDNIAPGMAERKPDSQIQARSRFA